MIQIMLAVLRLYDTSRGNEGICCKLQIDETPTGSQPLLVGEGVAGNLD